MRISYITAFVCFAVLLVAPTALAQDPIDSKNMEPEATFEHTFDQEGTWTYVCKYHASTMTGEIVIEEGAENDGSVEIGMTTQSDGDVAWYFVHDGRAEQDLTVRITPGTTVTWVNNDTVAHTVTETERDFEGDGTAEGPAPGLGLVLVIGLALIALRRRF
ncbi:MAG: hypothetical protein KY455_09305 [Euryarchaeota archaeon]|nr:hypothetical protein [Euryarchaeota archaeon]